MAQRFLRRTTPLPPNVRLFNRTLLLVLVGLMLFQCGRTLLGNPPSAKGQAEAPPPPAKVDDSSLDAEEDDNDESADSSGPNLEEAIRNGMAPHIAAQKDTGLARKIDELLRAYKPDHAFILLIDARTNEILAWGQRTDSAISTTPTFLKRSTFPAASLIKLVTAAAALESKRYAVNSELPNIGRAHTLYNNQLKPPSNYHGPTISLSEAFAFSNNSVMGRIGLHLGGRTLGRIGHQMGFNRHYPEDQPQMSIFLPPDSGYALAEAASGFTKANTLSPLHAGALMRAILRREPLALPWSKNLPDSLYTVHESAPIAGTNLSSGTYYGLRQMCLRTVNAGTSTKAIRRTVYSYNREGLDIGGKTGSLDGLDPKGRYDWFLGFAEYKKDPSQALVLAIMQVHGKYRSQSSTSLAGQLINHWAKYNLKSK